MKGKEPKYSLRHLAELSGLEPRTIRWYISEGLLMGPESRGPKAYYTERHRKRLETVRELKEVYNMPISEIRRYVTMAGDDDIQVVPVHTNRWRSREEAPRHRQASIREDESEYDMAMDASAGHPADLRNELEQSFLSDDEMTPIQRRAWWATNRPVPSLPVDHNPHFNLNSRVAGPTSPFAKLLHLLKDVLGEQRIHRQSRGTNWVEIEVTPDIVLRLRGDFGVYQLDLLEQLADHMRAYILGGGALPGPERSSRDGEGGPG